tara:strand:- start:38 stop:661 length:624 start_codon:yes stop_codon:yes gene_type:complete
MFRFLAKRLSNKQKEEITKNFINGQTIEELSKIFDFTKLTISRNLKQIIGEDKFKELILKSKSNKKLSYKKEKTINQINYGEFSQDESFLEIPPLNCEIENEQQKDLSSTPISEINFPKTVFMVVDKNIELEIKYLKDFPAWQFLSEEDLNRKTIEIFEDIKIAKNFCKKEQKVIKVPNTEVFRIVAPVLISKGISRIISSDKLIAL